MKPDYKNLTAMVRAKREQATNLPEEQKLSGVVKREQQQANDTPAHDTQKKPAA